MSIDVGRFARGLRSALAVDEFIISEMRAQTATRAMGKDEPRHQRQAHALQAMLYVDRKNGRGEALLVPRDGQELTTQIQEASTRAFGALGAAWALPAPAAPARVPVHDSDMSGSPGDIAEQLLGEFSSSLPSVLSTLHASVHVQHRIHRAVLSNGFDNRFQDTEFSIEATVQAPGGTPVPMHLRARRRTDIDMNAAAERAHQRSLDDAKAVLVEPGLVDLVLRSASYLPRTPEDFGFWTPLVDQASASRFRAGMSIHNPGQPLLSRPVRGETLSIRSVGTEPYGLRSAPFSDDGQAIRNFTLAEKGKAIGFSVNHQDAALGAGPANGGVRRLIVPAGTISVEELSRPSTRPLLVAHSLSSIRSTGQGHLYLEIAHGELLRRDSLGLIERTPIRSAVLCGKLYNWLENAYFSRETRDENWFLGPSAIRLDAVRVH